MHGQYKNQVNIKHNTKKILEENANNTQQQNNNTLKIFIDYSGKKMKTVFESKLDYFNYKSTNTKDK